MEGWIVDSSTTVKQDKLGDKEIVTGGWVDMVMENLNSLCEETK